MNTRKKEENIESSNIFFSTTEVVGIKSLDLRVS